MLSQSVRHGGEAWGLFTVFIYSSSSLVKRFANSFSYSARVSSVVAILNMRQITEKDPQVTRQLQSSIDLSNEMDNLVFRAWLPSYPGLVTNVNHFTSLEPPVTKFPCGGRFCLQCFFFLFFFAADVGPDENRECSKKVLPLLR